MNVSTVIIIAILCLAIGYIAGLLVSSLVGNQTNPEIQTENPEIEKASTPLATTLSAETLSTSSNPLANSAQQVPPFDQAHFWRDRPGGPLQIGLDGKSFSKASSLTPGQQKRLVVWVTDIQAWLGISSSNRMGANKKDNAVNSSYETQKVETRLDANPKPSLPLAHKSIVSQIDEILQDQISGTALAGRRIKLTEAPGQGVTVWIGLAQFQGIDAVADAEVVAAIRHAVNTWEAKAG